MKPTEPADPADASPLIQVSRDGFIATVVLNRPHKLNALTRAMWQRLGEVFHELSADRELRCIVLRGAGERAFSPGNDISEFAAERSGRQQASEYGGTMHAAVAAIKACPHPIVAQIQELFERHGGDAYFGDVLVQAGEFHLAPAGSVHDEVSSDHGALLFVRGRATRPLPPG